MSETLLRLKSKSSQNAEKITAVSSHYSTQVRGVSDKGESRIREFTAFTSGSCAYGGTYNIKIPAHGGSGIIREIWLEVALPQLSDVYAPALGAHFISRMKLKCGNTFYDLEPRVAFAIAVHKWKTNTVASRHELF